MELTTVENFQKKKKKKEHCQNHSKQLISK